MIFFSLMMILRDDPNLVLIKVLVAFLLTSGLYFLFKFGLRRFKFKKKDLKAVGLNHQQQR